MNPGCSTCVFFAIAFPRATGELRCRGRALAMSERVSPAGYVPSDFFDYRPGGACAWHEPLPAPGKPTAEILNAGLMPCLGE